MVLKHVQKCIITRNSCTGCCGEESARKTENLKTFSVCPIFYNTSNGKNTSVPLVSQRIFYSDLPQITKLTFLCTFKAFTVYSRTD